MQKYDINYRLAALDDIPVLVENRIDFMLEIQGSKTQEEIDLLRKELYSYFIKTIKDNSFIAFLAEIENKTVGFSGLVLQSIPPSFSINNGSIAYILNMYTQKNYRGLGICSKLMDLMIEKAKELNIKKLYLNATKDGYPIYIKKGFHSPNWVELELKL
jgi:GNAT superfamily N-acetyltransferase